MSLILKWVFANPQQRNDINDVLPGQYHRAPYLLFSVWHFKKERKRSVIEQRKSDMGGRVEGKVEAVRWQRKGELE